ncbi:maleylpyruvate isomerase family mycothiol-dependent enzyme [Mycolicibacterium goodii]|uniref:Maleylpyruvate isomerase family mycothiol-dependent enzyme n=1 Tax=Mycolicibacterium goodii TaxID=134601 RepID=A0A0K0X3X9_MYCGD|nr:hypothetical protein AFA91_09115 [Mycolicibacterium goodii]
MDDNTLLTQLQTDVLAFQSFALAEDTELSSPVQTCPDWTVADLLGHLWSIQTWVREILRTREVAEVPQPQADPTRVVADFLDGIPDYLTAMRAINADEPCWGFGPKPRLAGFWTRRQAHEHAIHRVDLHSAVGGHASFAPDFCADGVDEILTVFYPRQVHRNRTDPVSAPVQFRTADTDHTWTVGGADQTEPVATVTAPAEDLYLGLWKRRDLLDTAKIDGDTAAAQQALTVAFTP